MPREKQVNVRVTEATKEEWVEFEEESNLVDGLADLVRRSVNATVETDGATLVGDIEFESGDDSPSSDVTGRLTRIEDELMEVVRTIERVDETTEFIEEKVAEIDSHGSPVGDQFSDRLMRAIPPAKPGTEEWERKKSAYESHPRGKEVAWEGDVNQLAEKLDRDVMFVEQALQALRSQSNPTVEWGKFDGATRYWSTRDLWENPFADLRTGDAETQKCEGGPR